MICLETRRLILKEIQEHDVSALFAFRNAEPFLRYCTFKGTANSESEFREELQDDFAYDRHIQMLIIDRGADKPLGTIYSYEFNTADEHAFVSMFVNKDLASRWTAVEAATSFLLYLFEHYGLFKIYMDVYGHNTNTLSILRRNVFKKEGVFIGHRKRNGERIDLHRFALYRDDQEFLKNLYSKLTHRDYTP